MKKWLLLGICLLALLFMVAQVISLVKVWRVPKEALTMVIIPSEDAVLAMEQFAPYVEYLSQELGRDVELMVVPDYAAVVEAMKYKHADIARFGPANYVFATREAKIEAIAGGVKASTGEATYRTLIITRADSGVTSLDQVKTFGFSDVGSCSGYQMPTFLFRKMGIELDDSDVFFSGAHSATIEAVKNGAVDAGSIPTNRYYVALEEGVLEDGEVIVLWESEPIPVGPIAVQSDMDPALKQRLLDALLDMPQDILDATALNEIGYVPMTDDAFDQIREMQEVLGLIP